MSRVTVTVESPFAATETASVADHETYLRRCLNDCFVRGEAPFASHGLYPGALDDDVPGQRQLGIQAGFAVAARLEKRVVYTDYGVTRGMQEGITHAKKIGQHVEERSIGRNLQEVEA